MILEMLVGAGVVALGAATVRVIMRRRSANAVPEKVAEKKPETKKDVKKDDPKKKKKAKGKEKEESSGPRGLRVGDVLL